jgi:phosphatidylserine/phosphatidylglycerophosphate/cardiolipin synthase-like enzyme
MSQQFAALKEKARLIAAARREQRTKEETQEVLALTDAKKEAGTMTEEGELAQSGVGQVLAVLDAVASHEQALGLIDRAKEYVMLFGFTYDRQDITDALNRAAHRGVEVQVGLDRRYTLSGKCRDQLQTAKQLRAEGVVVNLLDGESLADHYRMVGRTVYGLGIARAKVLHSDRGTVIGSCNWTTSSRSNYEIGVWVELRPTEAKSLRTKLQLAWLAGAELREAEVSREQQRSVSPASAADRRRARSQPRSALELEAMPACMPSSRHMQ